ncbi:MAG TPA: Uma2 family endonuclease [Tepidisphaeraceae bacterium]|jgi:Uma2 family endonuclease|nr:Uma2 family endonuclease [Tepidisphaeraceae bacterium]
MSVLTSQPATRTYTPEALLGLPDAVSYELVDGRLVERNVSVESSRIAACILYLLKIETSRTNEAIVYGPDLGYQCFPNELDRIRKPDVSAVRTRRMEGMRDDPGYMPIPADLAVEVISPNDLAYEVAAKVEEYLAAGFGVVWVVHPQLRTVTIYKARGIAAVLHEDDEITAEPALAGFRCRVGDFFKS